MGWFLRANTGGKSRRGGSRSRSKRKSSAPPKLERHHKIAALKAAGWALLIGSLVSGWVWGKPALRAQVAETRAAKPRLDLGRTPGWMSKQILRQLHTTVRPTLGANPFDRLSLQATAANLQASPWVHRVHRVIRRPDGRLEVRAEYREPAALIEARDGYHLVDNQGIRLPLIYKAETARKMGLPVLQGVEKAPPRAGRLWGGGDVQAGLRLALLVDGQSWSNQVAAIDVSNYGGRRFEARPHLKLLTELDGDGDPRNNPGVRWGRAPGNEQFYEPSARTKLRHLRQVLRRFRRIDAAGQIVDVFSDSVLIHASTPTSTASDDRKIRYTRGP